MALGRPTRPRLPGAEERPVDSRSPVRWSWQRSCACLPACASPVGHRAAPDRSVCPCGPRTGLCRCRACQRTRSAAAVCAGIQGPPAPFAAPPGTYPAAPPPNPAIPGPPPMAVQGPQFQDAMQLQQTPPPIGPAAPPPGANPSEGQSLLFAGSNSAYRLLDHLEVNGVARGYYQQRPADRVVGHGRQLRRRGHHRAAASPAVRRFRVPHRQRVLHQRAL